MKLDGEYATATSTLMAQAGSIESAAKKALAQN